MSPDGLAARLLQTFLAELDDQLGLLEGELLAMERGTDDDAGRLARVFRVVHTLKGAAGVADVPIIETTCHALESQLADARARQRPLEESEVALLLSAVDALGDAGRRLREGQPADSGSLRELQRKLSGRAAFGAGQPSPLATSPTSTSSSLLESTPARRSTDVQSALLDVPINTTGEHAIHGAARVDRVAPSLRVETSKLNELLNATGQLSVTVARTAGHPDELEALAREAERWLTRWRRGAPRLRQTLARAGEAGRGQTPISSTGDPERDGTEAEQHLVDQLEVHLRRMTREIGRLAVSARGDARSLSRASSGVSTQLQSLRLRPFSESVAGLPRLVRDIAAAGHRRVALRLQGLDLEADRAVLDTLREALMHLVRNAVDHGIEPPGERLRMGKPAEGTVRIAAELVGADLSVTLHDDGRGLDTAAVRDLLIARGQTVPESEQELAEVLFQSGVSTSTEATAISGRGVGLDAVRSAVERARGSVQVSWEPGRGTTFTIRTPQVLATQRMLVVSVDGQPMAIPAGAIVRLLLVEPQAVRESGGRQLLPTPTGPVPLVELARVLGPPLAARAPGRKLPVAILEAGSRRLAIVVDALLDESELVVRPVERRGAGVLPAIAGAAMLADGRIALVLNPGAIVAAGLGRRRSTAETELATTDETSSGHDRKRPRVLVVDDSITTRTLEQSVLEAAGYDVVTAVDGVDGWRQLEEQGADLVITDVEMPRMDGFTLCETIRGSRRFSQLPVVLVTSLEDPERHARGVEAGADAYVVKSGFDQEALLAIIRELLEAARS